MRKRLIAIVSAAMVSGAVMAQQPDVIRQRQDLMKNNQESLRPLLGMSRGQAPFDATTVQASLRRVEQNAKQIPSLFPENSRTGKTNALPLIWEHKADFDARAVKLEQDARSAQTKAVDQASLRAELQAIGQNCGGCHDTYRRKEAQ
jgi:cytochrome c556